MAAPEAPANYQGNGDTTELAATPGLPDSTDKSALQHNIEQKKDLAYYYAHAAKKNTGEPPAPPPVHVPLHKTASGNEVRRETISTYSFLDDDKVVKLYVPLEGAGQLEEASISARFEERSFEVLVRGYGGDANRVLVLGAKRLHGDIEPSRCSHRRLANKVVFTLAKKPDEDGHCSRWQRLTP